MDEEITAKEAGQVKKLVEENLKLTEEIHKMVKKIKSYMFWQNVWSFLKILIIVVPIIIGIIYLPPLLKGVFQQYQSSLSGGDGSNLESSGSESSGGNFLESLLKGGGGKEIPPELEKYFTK